MRKHAYLLLGVGCYVLGLVACSESEDGSSWKWGVHDAGSDERDVVVDVEQGEDTGDVEDADGGDSDGEEVGDGGDGPCPSGMVLVEGWCMDIYEAPNREGALPLVMFHFDEAESWCLARGKRLCFDDEWTRGCGGPEGLKYPYGDSHESGVCTDDKAWRTYQQELLNAWPWSINTDEVETLDELLDAVRAKGVGAAAAADHVQWLYQADPSGSRQGCTVGEGVFDMTGNVEEWTRRRSGGTSGFQGNLKGRYWSETRTCQNSITTHGNQFRFYEIGFRCCSDVN